MWKVITEKLNGCIFFIEDEDLLEKYNAVWDEANADIKKKISSKPAFNKSYLKIKIKSHGDEVTDFYDRKIPKLDSSHTCLAAITLNSALKKDGSYYQASVFKRV